ncbi:MAG TPA: methyltransferase [Acetobacteraceae bacterium]|nr:methyltransferase [Acetobacteraceae bacterium]
MDMETGRPEGDVTPQRLLQMSWAYVPPLVIASAVRHGLFDALAREPMTAEVLSITTETSARGVRALADLLVGLDVLGRDEAGRYTLRPESEMFLVSGRPAYLGAYFAHLTQLVTPFLELDNPVRTGEPVRTLNEAAMGSVFFHDFVEALFPMNYPGAQVLAGALGLAQSAMPVSVLDMAAGSGVWGIALAQASPQVRVTAVDWPQVLPVAERTVARFGLQDRFSFVPGDVLTASLGGPHHAVILGHILHTEGEARSRALLRRLHEALVPGGTVAIAEFLVDEDRRGPVGSLIFAVNMLVNSATGTTFTMGEITEWLAEAGFVQPRLVPAPGPSPLLLATRA